MNEEKEWEAVPEKAWSDQQSSSDDTNSEAKESIMITPSARPGTDDINESHDISSDGLESIKLHTSQCKERMGNKQARRNKDENYLIVLFCLF
jgi:hypothetical protein